MAKAARLKDVAAETGLSEATVSRYLNSSISLPPSTRQRIDEAVARLRYKANPQARSLSLGRSDQIGLVIPDLANPFFAQIAAVIELTADACGLGLLLCTTSNRRTREMEYIHRLQQNQIDGLLFITNHDDDGSVAAAINATRGIVLLDEDVVGAITPKIFADNERGGRLAAQHLIEHGHRVIGIISGPLGLMSARERTQGVRHAVNKSRDAVISVEYTGNYTRDHGRISAARLLQEHPGTTALFTGNDEILVGVLEVLRDQGVSVPDMMSIVTFDDVEPLHLFNPPISAIRQDVAGMGNRAVHLLIDSSSSQRTFVTERIMVDLVVRASVAARSDTRSDKLQSA